MPVQVVLIVRIAPGKSRTFVLDFANEEDEIYKAFKPYYETTPVGENADPHRLSELQHRMLEWAIFTPTDVTNFAEVWYRAKRQVLPPSTVATPPLSHSNQTA